MGPGLDRSMERKALTILVAFAAVYLIWGSTYLAIRYAIESIPPFLMASARWALAGGALYAWRRLAGDARPTAREWVSAAIVGIALIVGGNGVLSWAQQWVPSGLAALLVAAVPLWIAILVWARGGPAPTLRAAAGIFLGLLGVGVLFAPAIAASFRGSPALAFGVIAIGAASLSWAAGSVYSRNAKLPKSILLAASMEMLMGSAALGILGLAAGEGARLDLAAVSAKAWVSLAFLVLFGSIVGFTAYVWLLREVRADLVATYAFVNPVVAVFLGTVIAGEAFTALTMVAASLIVVGVALVVAGGRREQKLPPPRPSDAQA